MVRFQLQACRDLVERTDGKWSYIVYVGELDRLVPVIITPEWYDTMDKADEESFPAIDRACERILSYDTGQPERAQTSTH